VQLVESTLRLNKRGSRGDDCEVQLMILMTLYWLTGPPTLAVGVCWLEHCGCGRCLGPPGPSRGGTLLLGSNAGVTCFSKGV
jgi:hypothetical protein